MFLWPIEAFKVTLSEFLVSSWYAVFKIYIAKSGEDVHSQKDIIKGKNNSNPIVDIS